MLPTAIAKKACQERLELSQFLKSGVRTRRSGGRTVPRPNLNNKGPRRAHRERIQYLLLLTRDLCKLSELTIHVRVVVGRNSDDYCEHIVADSWLLFWGVLHQSSFSRNGAIRSPRAEVKLKHRKHYTISQRPRSGDCGSAGNFLGAGGVRNYCRFLTIRRHPLPSLHQWLARDVILLWTNLEQIDLRWLSSE